MPITNDKHLKGNWAHQRALLWLLEKGYYVFNNVFGTGPIDIIAVDDFGHIELFDVKLAGFRNNKDTLGSKQMINRTLSPEQKELGVKLLYVFDNGECRVQLDRSVWLKKQHEGRDKKGRFTANGSKTRG
jgi:hypothetical protein|tara:strand:- start:730 stop:1119 length:390 start_codon:yes stop_codon:yes gene_type:complete